MEVRGFRRTAHVLGKVAREVPQAN